MADFSRRGGPAQPRLPAVAGQARTAGLKNAEGKKLRFF
jgi:hypothetical protein